MVSRLFMLLVAASNVLTIVHADGEGFEYGTPNMTCPPNMDHTGFFCNNITLEEGISGHPLKVTMDFNNSFDPMMMSFWTSVQVFTWFVTNQMLMDFWFNSTTPNNSILTSGSENVGKVHYKTGNAMIPQIPLDNIVTYNVTLQQWGCEPPMNETPMACQSGTIVSDIGLKITGETIAHGYTVKVWVHEPNNEYLKVYMPFSFVVNETWYCTSLDYQTMFSDRMQLTTEMCVMTPAGMQCHRDTHPLHMEGANENKTLIDNECFQHSFSNQTNQTMLRGSWRL